MSASDFPGWPAWPPIGTQNYSHLLWDDDNLAELPLRKAQHVLASLVAFLGQQPGIQPLEQEFLALADAVTRFPAAIQTRVWQDPLAFFWVRQATELIGAVFTGKTISATAQRYGATLSAHSLREKLAAHLERFQLLVLSLAHHAGWDFVLRRPLALPLPAAIPATRWSLCGPRQVEICGLSHGRLQVRHGGEFHELCLGKVTWPAGDGLHVRAAPVARYGTYELPLHPFALAQTGLEVAAPVLEAGLGFQQQEAAPVVAALAAMQRFAPDSFRHFCRMIRLAAFKPRTAGNYDDFSHPELPGSLLASAVHNPLVLADHLIHELQHNRLSLIEESGPLFDAAYGHAETDARFYSPWRDKPRALYGVFHGVYVFIAVARFWRNVQRAGDLPDGDGAFAVDRLLRLPRELALAVGVLRRHAHVTPLGRGILDQLTRDVAEIHQQAAAATLPADAPALVALEDGGYAPLLSAGGRPLSVLQSIHEHLRRNDLQQQCAGLLDEPAAAAA